MESRLEVIPISESRLKILSSPTKWVDVKGFYPETEEDVAERIRRVLKFVSPEKLSLNPDCGFGWSPRAMANQKLKALAAGARIVRKELTG